ncbi:MAG: hypothetical protein QOG92_1871, partial [Verrucomicrobiota bacterium]|nr:hypothetical protein [Verrucomicrobiota bacterium]
MVKTAFDQLPAVAPESEKKPVEEPLRLSFVPRRLAKIEMLLEQAAEAIRFAPVDGAHGSSCQCQLPVSVVGV